MSQTFSVPIRKVYAFHNNDVSAYTFDVPVTVTDGAGITIESAKQCVQEFITSITRVRRNDLRKIIFEETTVYILVEKNQVTLNGTAVRRICTSTRTNVLNLAYVETNDCVVHFFNKMVTVKPVVET